MIFKHKRTGKNYKWLFESFDVERQEHHTVYMQVETGFIFNRATAVFEQNFECINAMPQVDIIPNDERRK